MPRLDAVAMDLRSVWSCRSNVTSRARQHVVAEVLLDQVALVAAADHEIVQTIGRVDLHDVPENRLPADLDQRLRLRNAFFADAATEPARENDDFHGGHLFQTAELFPSVKAVSRRNDSCPAAVSDDTSLPCRSVHRSTRRPRSPPWLHRLSSTLLVAGSRRRRRAAGRLPPGVRAAHRQGRLDLARAGFLMRFDQRSTMRNRKVDQPCRDRERQTATSGLAELPPCRRPVAGLPELAGATRGAYARRLHGSPAHDRHLLGREDRRRKSRSTDAPRSRSRRFA